MVNVPGILTAAQSWAEMTMLDTCTVTRVTGKTFSEVTKLNTPVVVTVYTGKCQFKQEQRSASLAVGPGQVESVQPAILKLPVVAGAGVREGDVFTINTSLNPALVGVTGKIRGGHLHSDASARRLPIEVVS